MSDIAESTIVFISIFGTVVFMLLVMFACGDFD